MVTGLVSVTMCKHCIVSMIVVDTKYTFRIPFFYLLLRFLYSGLCGTPQEVPPHMSLLPAVGLLSRLDIARWNQKMCMCYTLILFNPIFFNSYSAGSLLFPPVPSLNSSILLFYFHSRSL